MSAAAINKLPDPDLFREAVFLADVGTWSPTDLEGTDALLLSLVWKIRNVRVKRGA